MARFKKGGGGGGGGRGKGKKEPEKSKFQYLMDSFIVDTPIPQSLRDSFPDIKIIQRYNPGLTLFKSQKKLSPDSTFNTRGTLLSWKPSTDSADSRFGIGKIRYANGIIEEKRVFVKTVHLLDPFRFLEGEYGSDDHRIYDWVPELGGPFEERYKKLYCAYNQAYIDAITQALLSRLREEQVVSNVLECYGTVIGVKENYMYDITDDFETLRARTWFWESIDYDGNRLHITSDKPIDPDIEDALRNPPDDLLDTTSGDDMSCKDDISLESDHSSDAESSIISNSTHTRRSSPADSPAESECGSSDNSDSIPGLEVDTTIEAEEMEAPPSPMTEMTELIDADDSIESDDEGKPVIQLRIGDDDNCTHCGSDTEEQSLPDINIRIKVECKNMPVLLLFQEAADGTMEELLDDEIDLMDGLLTPSGMSEEMGSCNSLDKIVEVTRQERDQRWAAWLAQIVAVLSQLQALIRFCHNDLHTKNIAWTKTTDQFIYYETNAGKVYKVPTYGKRFHLIDFGRATFALGDKVFLSDDFFPENDAAGQYNYDVCTDHEKPDSPYVEPNMSFDLCRLAACLVGGLYDETPTTKSRTLPPLSVEHGVKKWVTTSELYNCLWQWLLDMDGENILYDKDGEERFEGFDLYIYIARNVIDAVPHAQWKRSPFSSFETHVRPPATIKLFF